MRADRYIANPFCPTDCTPDHPGPLNPWRQEEHERFYAPVDNTQQAFELFVATLSNWRLDRTGAAILAHGEDGCGKTSLLHRCVYKLRQVLTQSLSTTTRWKVLIVDRSAEYLAGQPISSKCEDTVSAILRTLRHSESLLSAEDIRNLPSPQPGQNTRDLKRVMEDVAAYLAKSHVYLLLLTPPIELEDELLLYHATFTRHPIILLMESSAAAVRQLMARWNRDQPHKSILPLAVGPLQPGHGWLFVQSRMAHIPPDATIPAFDELAVHRYMTTRSASADISIRELELVCMNLFDAALQRNQGQIGYDAFCELWVQYGRGL
jgi:hypothetical protein